MAANKPRGDATVEFGEKTYVLRATMGAMAELETELGIDGLLELGGRLQKGSAKDLIGLFSALSRGGGNEIPRDVLLNATIEEINKKAEKIGQVLGGPEDGEEDAEKN